MYSYIVEGIKDKDLIKSVYPKAVCIITEGTRFGNRLRNAIRFEQKVGRVPMLLTDPDAAGDILAKMILQEFPTLHRIIVDKVHAGTDYLNRGGKVTRSYQVENCPPEYIRELLAPYEEPDRCSFYV